MLRNIEIQQGATFELSHTVTEEKLGTGAMTIGSAVLTATGLTFSSADIGRPIVVPGAGISGGPLETTVLSVQSATQVTLAKAAESSTAGASVRLTRPMNLTGYTGAMKVRRTYDASAALLDVPAVSGSSIVLGGAAGTIVVTVPAAATTALPAGHAVYDIELTQGAVVRRVLQGEALITPEATR